MWVMTDDAGVFLGVFESIEKGQDALIKRIPNIIKIEIVKEDEESYHLSFLVHESDHVFVGRFGCFLKIEMNEPIF